jgi:hypothetical protein
MPSEKKSNQENDGYMCVTLGVSIPCYRNADYDVENIEGEEWERLIDVISESEELIFAQHLMQLTGKTILEQVPGAHAYYTGLVKFTEEIELKKDGDSDG